MVNIKCSRTRFGKPIRNGRSRYFEEQMRPLHDKMRLFQVLNTMLETLEYSVSILETIEISIVEPPCATVSSKRNRAVRCVHSAFWINSGRNFELAQMRPLGHVCHDLDQ